MDNDKYQPSEPSLWLCVKISVAVVIILCVAVPALTIFVRTLPFMSPYEPGLGAVTMVTLYIAVPTVILGGLAGADFWL